MTHRKMPRRLNSASRQVVTRLMDTLESRVLMSVAIDAPFIAKSTDFTSDRFWQDLSAAPAAQGRQLAFHASDFETFQLNGTALRNKLANAPLEDLSY